MSQPKTKQNLLLLSLALAELTLAGCYGGDGHTVIVDLPTGPIGNEHVEGVWDAQITQRSGTTVPGVLRLDQSHPHDWELVGTLTSEGRVSDLRGAIAGRSITLDVIPRGGCWGDHALVATVDSSGRHMSGSLIGESCDGDRNATFTAVRR